LTLWTRTQLHIRWSWHFSWSSSCFGSPCVRMTVRSFQTGMLCTGTARIPGKKHLIASLLKAVWVKFQHDDKQVLLEVFRTTIRPEFVWNFSLLCYFYFIFYLLYTHTQTNIYVCVSVYVCVYMRNIWVTRLQERFWPSRKKRLYINNPYSSVLVYNFLFCLYTTFP